MNSAANAAPPGGFSPATRTACSSAPTWERAMYEGWWRLLETDDEYIPGRIWWRYCGLELPDDVLKNLYRENALRLLNWTKP